MELSNNNDITIQRLHNNTLGEKSEHMQSFL